ncbi:MAG: hypothetical protein ABSH50_24610 [Bryobacteraceae bacterium]|jgi:hypothetical protein
MAQAALKYVFAALLALLSAQAVAPSLRVVTTIEIVWRAEADQQAPQAARTIRKPAAALPAAPSYTSRVRPEPDAAVLFQRPPPATSLFS